MPYANPADAKAQSARHYQANRERLLRACADRRAAKRDEIKAYQADYRERLRDEAAAMAASREMPLCACGCGNTTTIIPRGRRRGEINKFLKGHRVRPHRFVGSQGYVYLYRPDSPEADAAGHVAEHVVVATAALGKQLPNGAEVHHHDRQRTNNDNGNLVVCQDRAYHCLLHVRMRALAACGNASYRRCAVCKRYDDPSRLRFYRCSRVVHRGGCP